MAILVIEPEELQEMTLEQYTKQAQKMLANVAKTKRVEMGFLFIDDYKFDEDDTDNDGDLDDQTVFITGTNFDQKWKDMDFNELKRIGYKQDYMEGKCLYDKSSGTLHLFNIEGGSILNKNLDLKFNNYLKDMQKKNAFKAWKFYPRGEGPTLDSGGDEGIEQGSNEDLNQEVEFFGTEEAKEAANQEREKLVGEIPDLSDRLAEAYEEASKIPELTNDNSETYDFEGKRDTVDELLEACGELRSDLMDIYKVYARIAKTALGK